MSEKQLKKSIISFRLETSDFERLNSTYPRGAPQIFLRNCIKKALADRSFFERIFFEYKQ